MSCDCYCHVKAGASCTVDAGHSPGTRYCGPHTEAETRRAETDAEKPPPLLTAGEAWVAFDKLVKPSKRKLRRDDGTRQTVEIPSLLDQLVEAMESGAGANGRGKQLSKPPLDQAALALLIEVAEHVRNGCLNWRIKRTRHIPLDLKAFVEAVHQRGNDVEVHLVATKLRDWCARIKATISNDTDRTWRMRGECTVCRASTIQVWDADETVHRQPTLLVHSDNGVIHKIVCSFCGTTLQDEDLTRLLFDTLKARDRQTA